MARREFVSNCHFFDIQGLFPFVSSGNHGHGANFKCYFMVWAASHMARCMKTASSHPIYPCMKVSFIKIVLKKLLKYPISRSQEGMIGEMVPLVCSVS